RVPRKEVLAKITPDQHTISKAFFEYQNLKRHWITSFTLFEHEGMVRPICRLVQPCQARAFFGLARSCRIVAAKTPKATMTMMIVASALTSGETPSLTLEKITMGRVDEPGPETKLAMTRSSSDRVKPSSQPDTRAGAMMGKVISKKVRMGEAPRSMAASSRLRSKSLRRDCPTTQT